MLPDPDAILLQHFVLDRSPNRYDMPYLHPTNFWTIAPISVSRGQEILHKQWSYTYSSRCFAQSTSSMHALMWAAVPQALGQSGKSVLRQLRLGPQLSINNHLSDDSSIPHRCATPSTFNHFV
jgi:hypothetical protein